MYCYYGRTGEGTRDGPSRADEKTYWRCGADSTL